MRRLALASLLAPLWAPAVGAIVAGFFWQPPHLESIDRTSWIAIATLFGFLYGYIAIIVVGLPAHFLLQSRGYRSLPAYLATFLACELVIWAIVYVGSYASLGLAAALSILAETIVRHPDRPVLFGIVGAVVGATFWAIVRPDRQPATQASTAGTRPSRAR